MISVPPPVCAAISAAASHRVFSRPQRRSWLIALRAVLVLVLCGSGITAATQTAHFDGAQIASIYGTSALTGTNVVAIAVDAAGDVVFTTQNPESSSLAFESSREAHTIPAAYHPARIRQFSDGPRNATAQKVNVSSCTYSGVGSGLFIRPANSSTVYGVSGLVAPMGLTFDSAGNLYVLDAYTGQIYKYLGVNGSIQIESFYGTGAILNGPFMVAQLQGNGCTGGQMAMDALGNLYYTTFSGGALEEIQATNGVIPPSPTSRSLGSGFGYPFGVAVDSSENVYVADVMKNAVFELVAVNGGIPASPTIRTLGSGFKMPAAVGLDSRGDVYVSDYSNNALKEMVAINGSISSSPTIEVLGTFNETAAVTLDRSGNVFVGEAGNLDGTVIELALNGANFGLVNVGSTSESIPMTFTFDTAGTLGSTAVLTQGAAALDFANAGTGTCKANTAYAAGQSCTVNVTFTAKFPGTRNGAAVLYDSYGNAIATGYVQGTGVGPQVIYSPALISTPVGGIGSGSVPVGVAVDGSGNVYVANLSNAVTKIPLGCTSASCVTTLGGGFSVPSGVAVDGSGNVYVADQANNAVKVMPSGCANASCVTTLGGGFSQPMGVAVDGSGNVYVADQANNAVKEMPPGCASASCVTTLGGGFSYPRGVAVDGSGNVYVGDNYNDTVKEIPSGCASTSCVTTLGGGFNGPEGVAVDGNGNVYVVDTQNGAVKEMAPGCASTNCVTTLGDGFDFPAGVAVDGSGNVYFVDYSNSGLYEIGRATAPSLTFPSTYVNATSAAQTVTITNDGNAPLNFTQITYPANFPESTSATNDCMTTTSLASNEVCTLTIDFMPQAVGALTGSMTLLDNNLNAAAPGYATQSIALSGTGLQPLPTFALTAPSQMTLNQGGSSSSTIQVVPGTGFTGSVSLNSSGLPSGITASFSPNPTTGSSVLTLAASDSAMLGTATVTITGTFGTQSATTSLQVVVQPPPPSFSLGVNPSTLTVFQGGSGTSTINVYGQNGFSGSLSLAASNLPSGVTALFSPNPTTGTSTLTFVASSAAVAGQSYVTITGTSGTLTASIGIYLTIAPPPGFASSSENFGVMNIGSASPVQTLTYTFGAPVTLGSTAVLTQGATGLDFADAGSDTCVAGTVYTVGQSCTVNVTFSPGFAGSRYGAVVLNDSTGNAIATAYLQGWGVGPQINFLPGTESTVASTSGAAPLAIAVDGNGNIYIASGGRNWNAVWKETPSAGGYTESTVPTSSLNNPYGIAVDGSGNVYIADTDNNRVLKETPSAGTYTESVVVDLANNGILSPQQLAVDVNGNVYFFGGDSTTYQEYLYKETPSVGGYTQSTIPYSGVSWTGAIAVDGNGSVYIVDTGNGQVIKETPSAYGYIQTTVPTNGLIQPYGIAVDGMGNIYVANMVGGPVFKETLTAESYIQSTISTSQLFEPLGLAVDGSGNLYIGDANNENVLKEDFADAPRLSFANTAFGSTSTDSPQIVTVENVGNAPLSFPASSSGNNPIISTNFTLDSIGTSACPLVSSGSSTAGTLAAGASCMMPISFTPTTAGSLIGSLTLTDNNLNASAPAFTTQSVTLSGTATQAAPTITWATPAAIIYGTPLGAAQLNATSTVAGTFNYSPAAGTLLAAGQQTLAVTFAPTDSTDYTSATASVTLTVNQASPILTCATPAPIVYGTPISAAMFGCSSNVPGTFVYTPAIGTVPAAGSNSVSIAFTPTDTTDYTTAMTSVMLTVNKATPSITWAAPAAITYGTPLSGTQLNATSPVAGSFSYLPPAGTVLNAGTQTLTVTFTPNDGADYATAQAIVNLVVNQAALNITWHTPTAIAYGTALGTTQLNATSTAAGTFTYSPAAGTVLGVGSHTLTVTLTPTNAADYTTATANATVTLTVNKATPSITWATPAAITYGTALSATQLNASSPVAGKFTYSPAAGTTLTAGSHTLSVAFASTDTTDYNTASSSVTLTVNKATPSITWATPKAITYGTALSGTQLNASSSVAGKFTYSPVSGTVLTAGSHSLSVTFAPTDSADYATATDSMTLVVNKATPTVKLTSSASSIVVGKTLTFTATLTGSGVAPTGTASFFDGSTQLGASPPNGSGVATYSTSKLAVGKHSITTSYGGDENYNGATSTVVSVTVTAN
jgi:streptogramin lyase